MENTDRLKLVRLRRKERKDEHLCRGNKANRTFT